MAAIPFEDAAYGVRSPAPATAAPATASALHPQALYEVSGLGRPDDPDGAGLLADSDGVHILVDAAGGHDRHARAAIMECRQRCITCAIQGVALGVERALVDAAGKARLGQLFARQVIRGHDAILTADVEMLERRIVLQRMVVDELGRLHGLGDLERRRIDDDVFARSE